MLNKLIPRTEFSKNVLTILTGSTISQIIPILISPILTRIYTPSDFGIFALYLSVLMIISSVATGKYEMAIILAKSDEEVASIVRLIVIVLICVSLVVAMSVLLLNEYISMLLGQVEIKQWLYYLPISIFLIGFYQILNHLLIRYKLFKMVSQNKVFATTTNSSLQLYIGFIFETAFGFLFGRLFSNVIGISLIIKNRKIRSILFCKKKTGIKSMAIEYKSFPIYDVPSTLVNTCSSQAPLIFLNKYFSVAVLGFYSLMNKVVLMPISILSKSVQDVFKQKASEDYNMKGNCKDVYEGTFKKLFLLGLLPFTLLGALGPEIFSFVFGSKWVVAGEFAQILAPLMFLKFIVSPLSYTFYIVKKQKIDLIGQVIIFSLTIGSMTIGVFNDSVSIALGLYSASVSVMYLTYLAFSYHYSKGLTNA